MILFASLILGPVALKPYALAGFKVSLPAAPVVLDAVDTGPRTKSWYVRTPGGTVFTIAYAEGGKEAEKTPDHVAVAQLVAGFAKSSKGTLTDQKDILLNGWRGVEASLRCPKFLVWGRAYGFPGGVFFVTGTGGKASKALVDAVLASIEIDPKRGTGPYREAGPVWERTAVGSTFSVEFPTKVDRHEAGDAMGVPTESWLTTFGNRRYAAFVTPFPEGTLPATADVYELAKSGNAASVSAAHGKIVRRKATTVLGQRGETVEATGPEAGTTMIFQTAILPEGSMILVAVVPTCLKDSPEVVRFLASPQRRAPQDDKPGVTGSSG